MKQQSNAPRWCNQTYTIGGSKYSKVPGFIIELTGADNIIDAEIKPIQKDRTTLMHKWLDRFANQCITIYIDSNIAPGYIDFYISDNLSVICGEGEYGQHIDVEKLKAKSTFIFYCS